MHATGQETRDINQKGRVGKTCAQDTRKTYTLRDKKHVICTKREESGRRAHRTRENTQATGQERVTYTKREESGRRAQRTLESPRRGKLVGPGVCTIVDRRSSQLGSATMLRCLALRYQTVWSPPVFHSLCVCDLCRARVLVRLSHPQPPDRSQHGCTVGVLPGHTRVLPMPRQCGIGRRAPTRAVLASAVLWCLMVHHPHVALSTFGNLAPPVAHCTR